MGSSFLLLSFGIAGVLALHWPLWYQVADLNLAYVPMAWLGSRAVWPAARRA